MEETPGVTETSAERKVVTSETETGPSSNQSVCIDSCCVNNLRFPFGGGGMYSCVGWGEVRWWGVWFRLKSVIGDNDWS